MSYPCPKEQIHTEELLFIGKVEESLEIFRILKETKELIYEQKRMYGIFRKEKIK